MIKAVSETAPTQHSATEHESEAGRSLTASFAIAKSVEETVRIYLPRIFQASQQGLPKHAFIIVSPVKLP